MYSGYPSSSVNRLCMVNIRTFLSLSTFFLLNSIGNFISTGILNDSVGRGSFRFSSFAYDTNYILNRNALELVLVPEP